MTLGRCKTIQEFAWKRWLRLWPAMAIASVLLVAFSQTLNGVFWDDRGGPLQWREMLPGLTFLPPVFWESLGWPLRSADGAFWSIYVEVTFYVCAGCAYFLGGRLSVIGMCVVVWLASFIADGWINYAGKHFIWFAVGASFYLRADKRLLWMGIVLSVAGAVTVRHGAIIPAIAAMLVAALFLGSLYSTRIQALLSFKALLWVGSVSYPLYLIHQNLTITLVKQLDSLTPILAFLMASAMVFVFAWGIALAEPFVRDTLRGKRIVKLPKARAE